MVIEFYKFYKALHEFALAISSTLAPSFLSSIHPNHTGLDVSFQLNIWELFFYFKSETFFSQILVYSLVLSCLSPNDSLWQSSLTSLPKSVLSNNLSLSFSLCRSISISIFYLLSLHHNVSFRRTGTLPTLFTTIPFSIVKSDWHTIN